MPSNMEPFNHILDLITERETVFDFVSRLSIGIDFINQDYDDSANAGDKQVIIPANTKLKDGVLMQMIRTMDVSDILHLDKLKTAYKYCPIGTKEVSIKIPSGCNLYRIVQEKTGQDVTPCFTKKDGCYVTKFDVPLIDNDTFKAYYSA